MIKSNKIKSTKKSSNLISNFQHLISNDHEGITLVALIITIIVMLILVGVTISIAINGGLFDATKKAAKETENAKNIEQALANGRVKIGETWYDSIEDYVNDKPSANQGEGGETPITPPEKPVAKPEIGDYVDYEPDVVSESYELLGKYSGHTSDQEITQDTLNWQILKIYEDGSIALIGKPTTQTIYFKGALGYNNGVYLMHDLCNSLYSKTLQDGSRIEARSVSLEDFEDEENEGNWKETRDAYINSVSVQYGEVKTYTTGGFTYYPNLYAQENGSGIDTDTAKTNGIEDTNPYYETLTEETSSKASKLTAKTTYYNIPINGANYGKSAEVLSQDNLFWVASRYVSCFQQDAYFGLRCVAKIFTGYDMFINRGVEDSAHGAYLRPVVSLKSSVQLELTTEGEDGAPNTFEITKY